MDVMRPSVTIGIPVVAELDTLELAIRSVFAQTYAKWELVIVCDGSPANVVDRVRQIRDPRVSVVADGASLGLPVRLNQISRRAKADLVCRMDADDVMHPDRIATQISFLAERSDVDVVGTRSYLIDEDTNVAGRSREPDLPTTSQGYLRSSAFFHPTVMYRRTWAVANPYLAEWIRTEDKELWLRTNQHSSFAKLDVPLTYYRIPRHLSARKQRLTSYYDRRLIRAFAAANGWSRVAIARYLVTSVTKQVLFQGLISIGLSRVLYAQKYDELGRAQFDQAVVNLATIRATSVPGWD